MESLKNKKILLAISGSIAAYKSAVLTRLLIKGGAEVQVVMTEDAKSFITPLTLSTLSKNPVHSAFQNNPETGEWTNHVELGLWADLMLIAPLSANTLAKMSVGRCDNLLMAVYLSAKCPVMVAPAMDLDMYLHETTHQNLAKLKSFGKGRMSEPEDIVEEVKKHFNYRKALIGKKVLITAGPTHERLDPVRFIGNYSTGKMGYAIALQCAEMGADVVLVSGPSILTMEHPQVRLIRVVSATEMHQACLKEYDNTDIAILSAAVADFRPKQQADFKLKKSENLLQLELEPTVDILKDLGSRKKNQVLVGFALETNNEIEYAKEKLERKNLDMVVLNSLNDPGAGFAHSTNKVTLIDRQNNLLEFELKDKREVAQDIMNKVLTLIKVQ